MDDRRFDALVRSLAFRGSRRRVLKGLLGLGGAAVAGGAVVDVDAVRRPAVTPTPVPKCPGSQTWNGTTCVCGAGLSKCGPDCCNPAAVGAAHSECCDSTYCFGKCYDEELCCPYPREFCPVSHECCMDGWKCCPDFGGCISPDQCCTAADCPFESCSAAQCAGNACEYRPDCRAGNRCCESTELCFRSDCQADGSCGKLVFDCHNGGAGSCCEEFGEGFFCAEDGTCDCVLQCQGRSCGDDGCGGSCGACPAGRTCTLEGLCAKPCASNDDCPGCLCVFALGQGQFCMGGSTGTRCATSAQCLPGQICNLGACQPLC